MTVREAADFMGVKPAAVYRMEASGAISRIDGIPGVRFRRADVERLAGEAVPRANRLLAENDRLKQENAQLRRLLKTIYQQASEAIVEDYEGGGNG